MTNAPATCARFAARPDREKRLQIVWRASVPPSNRGESLLNCGNGASASKCTAPGGGVHESNANPLSAKLR